MIGPGAKGRMLIPFKMMIGDTFSLPAMLQPLSILINKPVQGCMYLLVINGRAEVGVGGFADGIH